MTAQNAIILRLQNARGWRMTENEYQSENNASKDQASGESSHVQQEQLVKPVIVKEVGGPRGLEPTRYGDWEKNGRCIDF